jgi:glycosyltransferase involved in cell wall biosynthesis
VSVDDAPLVAPRVSVLLPTYNRAPLLQEVLAGLLSQPLRDIEILVMDDGSQDDTQAVAASFADARIRYFRRNRTGPSANLNEALSLSTGQYVMVVHDHDIYDPEMLTEFAAALDRHPTAAFAFCSYIFVDSEAKAETQRWVHHWPELLRGRVLLHRILLPTISSPILGLSMIRRAFINKRFLDTAVGPCADVELWHRLASVADAVYVKRPLIKVRERDSSSQFHGAAATVDMLAKVLHAKKPYLAFVPNRRRRQWLLLRWRFQVDCHGVYSLWKAFEADDRDAMKAVLALVKSEGTALGYLVLLGLSHLPCRCGVVLLRCIRRIYRTIWPKPGAKPA